MRRLHLLVLALLACALFAVGCGDDDEKSNNESDEPDVSESAPADTTAEETEEEAPAEETEEEAPAYDAPELPDDVSDAAVESCKQSVNAAAQLSDDVKNDLEEICEKAASGDEDAVREASVDVCKKIVEDSVPAGPAREQALDSCDAAQ